MKKLLSIVLSLLVLASVASLAACGSKKEEAKKDTTASGELKFGLGIYTAASATSAEGDTKGAGEAEHTAAAVLVGADGKIVKCVIDTIAVGGEYTSAGKAEAATEFKTKYELKEDYGMKAYAGAAKEWYEQVDAFVGVVEGKTISDVKKLIAEGDKGTEDVVNAGCTIKIADFVYALEKAVNAAKATDAKADNTLKLGMVASPEIADAADADGKVAIDTTVTAAALDADAKVVVAVTDAVSVEFAFDGKGASKFDAAAISTKREKGDNYNMAAYGTDLNGDGVVKEWYAQADVFDAACKGLNAAGIAKLAVEAASGSADLQTAGCTIHVGDMVKAAVKAAN